MRLSQVFIPIPLIQRVPLEYDENIGKRGASTGFTRSCSRDTDSTADGAESGVPTACKTQRRGLNMVTQNDSEAETERAQVNEIADQWTVDGEYPAEVSKSDVQELGQILYGQLEDRIKNLVADTTFTRLEAEVWALTKSVDEHRHFLTADGVALLLSTPGTGFGDPADSTKVPVESCRFTAEEVQEHFRATKRKINEARETIGAVTFPDRETALTSPEIVWLDRHTVQRLRSQRQSDDNTLNDVAARVLDETETRRSLEELVRGYLASRGQNNVAQLAVHRQSFKTGTLHITSHTGIREELPDIVTDTDAIILHGQRYDLHFTEDPSGPQDLDRITLYASDNIIGMDETPLEDGLATVEEYMQELRESEESLPSRTVD